MEIRRAKREDAAILTEIAFAAKRHWAYPERWSQQWKEVLTIQPEFVASHETFIVCVEGRAVGFYALVGERNETWLEHLWVLPIAMGQGVGRALFEHAIGRAKALGVRAIKIESDPHAEKFYERMGARRVGENVSELDGELRTLPVLTYEFL